MLTAIWDFLFHRHKWEMVKQGPFVDEAGRKTGDYYIQKCTKCQDIRHVKCW